MSGEIVACAVPSSTTEHPTWVLYRLDTCDNAPKLMTRGVPLSVAAPGATTFHPAGSSSPLLVSTILGYLGVRDDPVCLSISEMEVLNRSAKLGKLVSSLSTLQPTPLRARVQSAQISEASTTWSSLRNPATQVVHVGLAGSVFQSEPVANTTHAALRLTPPTAWERVSALASARRDLDLNPVSFLAVFTEVCFGLGMSLGTLAFALHDSSCGDGYYANSFTTSGTVVSTPGSPASYLPCTSFGTVNSTNPFVTQCFDGNTSAAVPYRYYVAADMTTVLTLHDPSQAPWLGPQVLLGFDTDYSSTFAVRLQHFSFELDAPWCLPHEPAVILPLFPLCVAVVALLRMVVPRITERTSGMRHHLRGYCITDAIDYAETFKCMHQRVFVAFTIASLVLLARYSYGTSICYWLVLQLASTAMMSQGLLVASIVDSALWGFVVTFAISAGTLLSTPPVSSVPGLNVLYVILFPPAAAWYSLTPMLSYDNFDLGVPMAAAIVLLVLQTLLYFGLAHYCSLVWPGQNSIAMHPLQPLRTLCAWFSAKARPALDAEEAAPMSVPPVTAAALDLVNVTKSFGGRPVLNMTMNLRRGESCALLGHNGAGKSTLLSVLLGRIPADGYDQARILGMDLATRIDTIRDNIGYCPQYDVLYDDMDAPTNVRIAASLRGVEVTVEGLQPLMLFLELVAQQPVSSLSAGVRRRVSIACAFVGSPPLVLLDEPTTGIDDLSRRKIWSLIAMYRERGTSVVLATHLMEEAEVACDRIAIMAGGAMVAQGTAAELKQRYGAGRYLTLKHARPPADVSTGSEPLDCFDRIGVEEIIKLQYPEAALREVVAGESHEYFLPASDELDASNFGQMLQSLESRQHLLGVAKFELRESTLDDVFIKVLDDFDSTAAVSLNEVESRLRALDTDEKHAAFHDAQVGDTLPWSRRLLDHWGSMMHLRWQRFSRNKASDFTLAVLIPLALIAAAFATTTRTDASSGYGRSYLTTNVHSSAIQCPIRLTASPPSPDSTQFARSLGPEIEDALTQEFNAPSYAHTTTDTVESMTWYVQRVLSYNPTFNGIFCVIMIDSNVSDIVVTIPSDFDPPQDGTPMGRTTIAVARAIDKLMRRRNPPLRDTPSLPSLTLRSGAPSTPASSSSGGDAVDVSLYASMPLILIAWMVYGLYIYLATRRTFDDIDNLVIHGLRGEAYLAPNVALDALISSLIFPAAVVVGISVTGAAPSGAEGTRYLVATFFTTLAANWCNVVASYFAVGRSFVLLFFIMILPFGIPATWTFPIETANPVDPITGLMESLTPSLAWGSAYMFKRDPAMVHGGLLQMLVLWAVHVPFQLLLLRWCAHLIAGRQHRNTVSTNPPMALFTPVVKHYDADVAAEVDRVSEDAQLHGRPLDAVALVRIQHRYRALFELSAFQVKNLSLGVRTGEILGLVGPNSAGKSTLLKMMVQQVAPQVGDVTYGGVEHGAEGSGVLRRVAFGMCPQEDVLAFDHLTAVEYMKLYIGLRLGRNDDLNDSDAGGAVHNTQSWSDYAREAVSVLGVPLDVPVRSMSGGQKRKLSTALALFSGSSVIVLDEPTNGVDPLARVAIWRVIRWWCKSRNRTVIVTTHSMDEAERLCDRIAVVMAGDIKRLGTPMALRTTSGRGCVAEVTVGPQTNVALLDEEMVAHFGQQAAMALISHGGQLRSYAIGEVKSLAGAYREMADIARDCGAPHVVVGQTSLRQAYLMIIAQIL